MRAVRQKAGLGSLRLFATGAAPLAPEVFWGFTDLGFVMIEGYGLTETSPVVCLNYPTRTSPGAVGWPMVGVEVRIIEPDEDGDGEIAVRGPNVMLGYWNDPAGTAAVMRDGWFRTGDQGRLLPDGRIRITGRLKNMIATAAGKKIYPEEIEVLLTGSPHILEAVVLGGRDAKGEREEVHAYLYPDRPALEDLARSRGVSFDDAFIEATLRADVQARCEGLADYKKVKRVFVSGEEFAKTTTGKIRRAELTSTAP